MMDYRVKEMKNDQGDPVVVFESDDGVIRVYSGRLVFGELKSQTAGTQKKLV
jgi:hypothetical protein